LRDPDYDQATIDLQEPCPDNYAHGYMLSSVYMRSLLNITVILNQADYRSGQAIDEVRAKVAATPILPVVDISTEMLTDFGAQSFSGCCPKRPSSRGYPTMLGARPTWLSVPHERFCRLLIKYLSSVRWQGLAFCFGLCLSEEAVAVVKLLQLHDVQSTCQLSRQRTGPGTYDAVHLSAQQQQHWHSRHCFFGCVTC
jgi:hypothetical protein